MCSRGKIADRVSNREELEMRTAQDEDPDDVSGPNKEGSSRTSYRLGP